MINILWQTPANFPALAANEIHIWAADLNLNENQLNAYHASLSTEEQARAARFKFDIHRNRFSAAKGILRKLLGAYLKLAPQKLEFVLGKHGKPYLAKEISQTIFFNVSDSQDLALFAVTLNNEIGVDVEFMRDNIAPLEIAERFFSSQEQYQLAQLPEQQRSLAFFYGWTRKEAIIKAMGLGLSFQLDKFDVNLTPGEAAKLMRIEADNAEEWNLYNLEPAPNYAAALALKNAAQKKTETILRCFRFCTTEN